MPSDEEGKLFAAEWTLIHDRREKRCLTKDYGKPARLRAKLFATFFGGQHRVNERGLHGHAVHVV